MTAIELIAAERNRQISVEGFTPDHDDQHVDNQLANAAACYALDAHLSQKEIWGTELVDLMWPWAEEWWKPEESRIRNLVKAGALLVAEIERLQRLEQGVSAVVENTQAQL